MKLFRIMIALSVALLLAACSQATSSKKKDDTPVDNPSIDNFESYADTAAAVTAWPKNIWDPKAMSTAAVSLETAAPLVGTKSLHLQYGAVDAQQYALSDFPTNADANSAFFTNLKDHYKDDYTGIQLNLKASAWDVIHVIIRATGNVNPYQANIDPATVTGYATGTNLTIKIPFTAFTYQIGWTTGGSVAATYTDLKAALAAKYAFTDFTLEPEVDDTDTLGYDVLRDTVIDNITYY